MPPGVPADPAEKEIFLRKQKEHAHEHEHDQPSTSAGAGATSAPVIKEHKAEDSDNKEDRVTSLQFGVTKEPNAEGVCLRVVCLPAIFGSACIESHFGTRF